jgi:hypothetical protein
MSPVSPPEHLGQNRTTVCRRAVEDKAIVGFVKKEWRPGERVNV